VPDPPRLARIGQPRRQHLTKRPAAPGTAGTIPGGAGGAPAAPRWQRTTSISDDAHTGTALLRIIRIQTPR